MRKPESLTKSALQRISSNALSQVNQCTIIDFENFIRKSLADICFMAKTKEQVSAPRDKAANEIKKELAKVLFTREKLDQNIIAQRVGVTEKTISKWVNENEGAWKRERQRLLISKQDQLNSFYSQLEKLNDQIANGDGIPDTKQADIQIKLTAAVRNLETDLAIADLVESGMRFVKFIQLVGTLDQVKDFADLWNAFIQNEIRKK